MILVLVLCDDEDRYSQDHHIPITNSIKVWETSVSEKAIFLNHFCVIN